MSGQKMGFFFSFPSARLPPPGLNPNICFRRKTAWPLPASAAEALGTFPGAILIPQPPPGPFPSPTSPPCPWRTPQSQGRSFSTLYSLPGAFPYEFLCFTSEKQPRSGRNPGFFFPLKNSDLGAASAALSSPPKLGGLGWGRATGRGLWGILWGCGFGVWMFFLPSTTFKGGFWSWGGVGGVISLGLSLGGGREREGGGKSVWEGKRGGKERRKNPTKQRRTSGERIAPVKHLQSVPGTELVRQSLPPEPIPAFPGPPEPSPRSQPAAGRVWMGTVTPQASLWVLAAPMRRNRSVLGVPVRRWDTRDRNSHPGDTSGTSAHPGPGFHHKAAKKWGFGASSALPSPLLGNSGGWGSRDDLGAS